MDNEKEETKKEEVKQEVVKTDEKFVEVPAKFKDIVEKIEAMSVLEVSELVKVLEDKFGVSAQMVVAGGSVTGGADVPDAGGEEESTTKSVTLKSAGDQKIQVIKVVKEVLGLGLKEAKDFVDAAPKMVKEGLSAEEAEELKKNFEVAGAIVEIK